MNILPVSELRKKISSVLKEVEETGEPVFIVQYSNPRAVLVNYEVFNQLVKDMEELEALRAKVSGPRRSA
ncbi:MAG: type II toxin-antitoxin system Phd/YefM family antitoxin [Chloroflexi bacterium]|nr:type II toxin-antitoxin system Phd/YefM family antitoxin [Chloroflexota bacterium]